VAGFSQTDPSVTLAFRKVSHDLSRFGLGEMLKVSVELRAAGRSPRFETSAMSICRYLYDALEGPDGARACALVRCYKTHRFAALPEDLQRFAKRALRSNETGLSPSDDMKCLTLMATAGDEQAWNDRRQSRGHQAVPLPSPRIALQAPMIAQLIHEFGLALNDVIRPSPDVLRGLSNKTYGVFHVENAKGSPYIPAQATFVEPHGIRSVVGFGGSLNEGELFAVILFSRIPVSTETADRFRTIALDVKSCLLPFSETEIFA
jgi:hypothetical protein